MATINDNIKLPALVVINESGLAVAEKIVCYLKAEIFAPERIASQTVTSYSGGSAETIKTAFNNGRPLIMVMACGIAVRAISGLPDSKYNDPPVVVVDTMGYNVISLLSGHEGGANKLAVEVANSIDGNPVITTGTEAGKRFCLGIGCRKNVSAVDVHDAIVEFIDNAGHELSGIRWAATVEDKRHEPGLQEAMENLGLPLRIFSHDRIASVSDLFARTAASRQIGVAAVAEPCAFLAAGNGKMVVSKEAINSVTLALAEII